MFVVERSTVKQSTVIVQSYRFVALITKSRNNNMQTAILRDRLCMFTGYDFCCFYCFTKINNLCRHFVPRLLINGI